MSSTSSAEVDKEKQQTKQRTTRFCFTIPSTLTQHMITVIGGHSSLLERLKVVEIRYLENFNGTSKDLVVMFSSSQNYQTQWKIAIDTMLGIQTEFNDVKQINFLTKLVQKHHLSRVIQPPRSLPADPSQPHIVYVPMVTASVCPQQTEDPKRPRDTPDAAYSAAECPNPKAPRLEMQAESATSDALAAQINLPEANVSKIVTCILSFLANGLGPLVAPIVFEEKFGVCTKEELKAFVKKHNASPKPLPEIYPLLPPFVKNTGDVFKSISPGHAQCLGKLRQLLLYGTFEFYPFPVMLQIDYSVDNLNILEIHRRILGLEFSLSRMAKYLLRVCKNRSVTKPCLGSSLRNVIHLVLFNGTGLFGSGSSFFNVDESALRQIDVIHDFNSDELGNYKNVHDTVTWLRDNRENCMVHQSVAFAGHCLVHVPAFLKLALIADKLTKLSDPAVAQEVYSELNTVKRERERLCRSEVLPMIKYGANLTEYYKSVYQACEELNRSVKAIGGIAMPENISLSNVNLRMQMVDDFNNPIPNGHMDFLKKKMHYLIPFPVDKKSIKVNTIEEKIEAADRFDNWRLGLIREFKSKFPEADFDLFDVMCSGDRKLLWCFNEDSYECNSTGNLPATASLPHARFVRVFPFQ